LRTHGLAEQVPKGKSVMVATAQSLRTAAGLPLQLRSICPAGEPRSLESQGVGDAMVLA